MGRWTSNVVKVRTLLGGDNTNRPKRVNSLCSTGEMLAGGNVGKRGNSQQPVERTNTLQPELNVIGQVYWSNGGSVVNRKQDS